jgi:hypothetical protein
MIYKDLLQSFYSNIPSGASIVSTSKDALATVFVSICRELKHAILG